MLNCPNCGAPIEGHKCKYCNTVIFDFASIEVGKPIWISIKLPNGQIMLSHVALESMGIAIEPSEYNTVYADNEALFKVVRRSPPRLTMEFVELENRDSILHYISERVTASYEEVGDQDVE